MTIRDRDRKAIILGAAVLALVLGYRLVLAPLAESWRDARQRIEMASATRSALEAQALKLRSQRRRLEAIYGPAIGEPLPPVDRARANFVKTVEDLLKSSGMESRGVRSQPLRPLREVDGVALVGLRVECTGRSQQLAKCLAAMSEGEQIMLVESIRAAPDSKRPDRMQVSMVLATLARMEGSP